MLLIAVIALLIIYYFVFSSLGNNEDGQASSIKVFFETVLWVLFMILLLLNGISYIFGIDIIKSVKNLFGYDTIDTDIVGKINPEEKNKIKLVLKKQVFHLPDQKYTFDDASSVCNAYGARLATYDELNTAYNNGADWCTYGWSDKQMALYPTQKEKWDKLQQMPGHEKDCGHPGVNGGYMKDVSGNYGVNCYGSKPSITLDDATKMRNTSMFKKNSKETNFDKKVDYWRSKLSTIEIAPFNHNNWSML
jgi:hypothetical protein